MNMGIRKGQSGREKEDIQGQVEFSLKFWSYA